MKGLFPEYDDSTGADYALAWQSALFIFDTNVLLNLYRYQSATRDELLNVLEQLSSRIWIPHHVALEFQRNRHTVIAEQNRRFSEVRNTVNKATSGLSQELDKLQLKKRHSLINPDKLINGISDLVITFMEELETLQGDQQALAGADPLKERIEQLFDGRVGEGPLTQTAIDELYKTAELRFKNKIPPGYCDEKKEREEGDDLYSYAGLVYKRKFGDYVVWSQIIDHSKNVKPQAIVFVTDDMKEDWWRRIVAEGTKTLGPRPELIEELRRVAGVPKLIMYNPEGFLKYASEYLKATVSKDTLTEVREVSITRIIPNLRARERANFAEQSRRALQQWMEARFDEVKQNEVGFPDFLARIHGKSVGIELLTAPNPRTAIHRLNEGLYRGLYELQMSGLDELYLVWITENPAQAEKLWHEFTHVNRKKIPSNVTVIIGSLDDPETMKTGFFPHHLINAE